MTGRSEDGAVLTQAQTTPVQAMCSTNVARAFDFLGKRWNGLILGALRHGPTGFAELRRGVGPITDSVLSGRLGELTQAGLVQREVTDTRPPGVTYSLTTKGQALGPILDALGSWAADLPPCPRG